MTWTRHADGWVCGDVGVFPYLFSSWEVWVRTGGEWECYRPLMPFNNIEAALAAALEVAHGSQVP